MKKALSAAFLAVLFFGMGMSAQAQFRQSIFLNGTLPTGGFAKHINSGIDRTYVFVGEDLQGRTVPLGYTEIGKEAGLGFGLGYRASYRFDVGMGLVAPFVQGDFFWNMIRSNIADEYTNARAKSTPTYFNVPIFAGVSYLYDALMGGDIMPYGEFGIGTDLLFITSEGECTYNGVTTQKFSYKPTAAFAFMIGAGAYFGRHVSAGIYYYGLGKHTVKYTTGTYNNLDPISKTAYDNNAVQTRTVGSVALRIGFHF